MIQSKQISFADQSDYASDLQCPRCGGTYLHHTGVKMFERGEDDASGTVIITSGPHVSVHAGSLKGNPSSRRHGMVIKFECELCGPEDGVEDFIELAFAQHKGQTEVFWRFAPMKAQ